MRVYYSETELVAAIERLSPGQLRRFVEARFVQPVQGAEGPVFRRLDCARLELLCELADEFGMDDDTLDMVMSLVDQLHGVRAELRAVMSVIASEPEDVRNRLFEAIRDARSRGE